MITGFQKSQKMENQILRPGRPPKRWCDIWILASQKNRHKKDAFTYKKTKKKKSLQSLRDRIRNEDTHNIRNIQDIKMKWAKIKSMESM